MLEAYIIEKLKKEKEQQEQEWAPLPLELPTPCVENYIREDKRERQEKKDQKNGAIIIRF